MTTIQEQALSNARGGLSVANYAAIFHGFTEKGIAETEIIPRENVFTYGAWQALNRQVRKGEHGVKVVTFVPVAARAAEEGQPAKSSYRMPRTTTVFHVSQTDPIA